MGFRDAKAQVLACLNDENISHDLDRSEIDTKNLLVTGAVSAEQVAAAIGRSNGREYECSAHHFDATIDVHIIKTMYSGRNWYIKWYCVEPDAVFISVHE